MFPLCYYLILLILPNIIRQKNTSTPIILLILMLFHGIRFILISFAAAGNLLEDEMLNVFNSFS